MWWMFPYGVAHAQTFDASGSALPPQRPSLSAPFAGFGGAPADAASASLTLEAASSTLVRQLVDGDTVVSEPVVGSLFGAQLAARANVHRRLELGLSAPVWLAAQGVADGAAAGDMHLWAPVRIVDRGPAAVAVVPFVRVPTGADARYLGDPFGGGGLVSVGLDGERLFAHADVGLDVGGPTDAPDWAGGARGRGALDVGIGGRQAALHAELRSRAPLQSVPSVPVEGLVGLRLRPADAVGLSVSGGRAITRGVGAGSLRMLVGLSVQLAGPDDRVATDAVADRPNSRDVNVVDDRRLPVRGAQIQVGDTVLTTDHEGFASVPLRAVRAGSLTVSAPGYLPSSRAIHADDPYWEVQLTRAPVPVSIQVVGPAGPLADAAITVTGPADAPPPQIDASGVHTFPLSAGAWTVVIDAAGYGRQERSVWIDPARVDPLKIDAVLAAAEAPATQLRVEVVDGLGRPVEDAVVALEDRDLGTTGTGGDLTVHGVAPGEHAVVVRSTQYGQAVVASVEVPADGAEVVRVALDWQPGSVLVNVAGPDGRPTDAEVRFTGPEALPSRSVGTDGAELFTLRPGEWQVEVRSQTLAPQTRTVVVDDAAGHLVALDLVLQAEERGRSHLDLTVVDPDGAPMEGLDVTLDGRPVGRTGPDGTLGLRDLQGGVRFVEVRGDLVVPRLTEVDLAAAQHQEDVIVWWVDGVVDITAVTADGAALDATLTPFGGSEYPPFSLGPDGTERRVFPPGTWAFQASAEGLEPRARAVEVPEGTHRKLRVPFRLEPPAAQVGRLAVRITDDRGAPVPSAEVLIDGESAGAATNGYFQLDGVPLGPVAVEVRAPGAAPQRVEATVEAVTEIAVTAPWSPGAVQLTVTAGGAPVDAAIEAISSSERRLVEATGGGAVLALTPGTWTLRASAPGWSDATQTVTLPDAPQLTAVALVLRPVDAAVVVDVRRADGTPVANAAVIAEGVTVARTDASGRVTINPGAAELTIVAENSDLQPAELEVARGRGGQSYRVVLPAVPVPVDVTATDADGAPINASFSAFGPDNHSVMLDGPGSLALVPGAWTITARTADGRVGAARITVDAQGHPAVVVAVAAVASRQEGAQLRPAAPMWFDLDSAALRPDAEAIVHDLARWLNADRTVALVEVAGHTDDQGGVTYNQQLSEQRARAVRDALLARGVAPERLVARGYGLSRPVSADTTDAARQANRRVELVVVRTSGE